MGAKYKTDGNTRVATWADMKRGVIVRDVSAIEGTTWPFGDSAVVDVGADGKGVALARPFMRLGDGNAPEVRCENYFIARHHIESGRVHIVLAANGEPYVQT